MKNITTTKQNSELKKLNSQTVRTLRSIYNGRINLREIDFSKADFLQYLEYIQKYEMVFLTDEAIKILGYK